MEVDFQCRPVLVLLKKPVFLSGVFVCLLVRKPTKQ